MAFDLGKCIMERLGVKNVHTLETSYENACRCLKSSRMHFGKDKHMCVAEAQCFKRAVEGELGDLWDPIEPGPWVFLNC